MPDPVKCPVCQKILDPGYQYNSHVNSGPCRQFIELAAIMKEWLKTKKW